MIKQTTLRQNITKTLSIFVLSVLMIFSLVLVPSNSSPKVSAASGTEPVCNGTSGTSTGGQKGCIVCSNKDNAAKDKAAIACNDYAIDPAACDGKGCDLVNKYVNPAINVLSMIVGLLAVISIMAGGIQFATSDGDPQKASAAKSRISKTIAALVAYAFLYAFLQFLVPGGIFK